MCEVSFCIKPIACRTDFVPIARVEVIVDEAVLFCLFI